MRVTVDPNVCMGHAQCEDACPEVFEVRDDGLAHVLREDIPPELQGKVEEAVQRCPTGAITARQP